jgi:putative ABC transport system permease protein
MSAGRSPRWEFGRRLIGWRRRDIVVRDVQDEIAFHRELRVRELRAQGQTEGEARRQAAREVGDPARVVPRVTRLVVAGDRRRRIAQWADELRQDVRSSWRSSRRTPGFTALVVLTIAFGLGANAAIFGVVNVAVLAPLPFDPDNTLVRVREFRVGADGRATNVDASRRTADAVAGMRGVFSDSVPMSGSGRALARSGGAIRVAGMRVGPGFTRVVGVTPVLGRTFTPDEESAGEAGGAALVSFRFWQNMLGGIPTAVGEPIHLDGRPFVVVGVLPRNFHIPYDTDVWFPAHFEDHQRSMFVLARLAPGVSLDQARAALLPVGDELNRRYPDVMRGLGVTAVQAREFFVNDEAQLSLVLMGAVAVLLLIACTNVALLLTTKFAARQGEVAMRAALGCSRGRQIRQFVTEGVLLFALGGGVGLCVAVLSRGTLIVLLPETIATQVGFTGIPLDWRLVGFSAVLSATAGIVFGLLAAMRTSGADLHAVMKSGGRLVAGASSRGFLGGLVVAEVALAVVLLFGAGVMVEAFQRLNQQDLGFDPQGVLTARLDVNAPRYASPDARRLFAERVLTRVRQIPGVTEAGGTTVNPLCCGNWGMRVVADGMPPLSQHEVPIVQHFIVTPGYFDTLRRAVVEGRDFSGTDGPGSPAVVIIDRRMADRFWPAESALGKRVRRWSVDDQYPWLTVVGVVATATEEGDYGEAWYLPHAQHPAGPSADGLHLMVRSESPATLERELRAIVAEEDPALALYDATWMDALVAENLQQDRLGAWVSSVFALVGLLLAALGLYGVLSFVVAGDRVEIAVRRALGASGRDVVTLILRRGLTLVGAGVGVGAVAAWGAGRVLPRIFESAQPDLSLIAWASGVLLVAALLAMVPPVRRALRLDPLDAMRT